MEERVTITLRFTPRSKWRWDLQMGDQVEQGSPEQFETPAAAAASAIKYWGYHNDEAGE